MTSIMKSTKQALDRGLKYKQAVRDQRNASSSSKWKPPSIPLTTPVGVEDMTLQDMMKKEKLSYADAVTVYLALQESLKKPSKKPKSGKAATNSSCESAAPAETEEAQPKRKKTKAEEVDKKSGKQPPAQEVGMKSEKQPPAQEVDKKSRKQPPSEALSVEGCNSKSVTPKAKASKAKSPSLKRKGAFLQEPEAEVHEPPTKRIKGKTPAEASHIPQDPTLDEDSTQVEEAILEGEAIPDEEWEDISYEYDLWRQGLPQSSELEAHLRDHRALPEPVAVPEPAADAPVSPNADANDSQVCFGCNERLYTCMMSRKLSSSCDQFYMNTWV